MHETDETRKQCRRRRRRRPTGDRPPREPRCGTERAHPPRPSHRFATPPSWPTRSRRAGRTAGKRRAPSRRRTRPARWPPPTAPPIPADKLYLLDMFPYPSGQGLHVGHPLGYIGTDVMGRFMRMTGRNVLHTIGYDAFGLPAEQYAVRSGTHPRETTEANIRRFRAQLRRMGFAHDQRRSVATTDPEFLRWTQWIFTQLFEAWYDPTVGRARPIGVLVAEFESGSRRAVDGRAWSELSRVERHQILDAHRLAYIDTAPVNWCPGLGTVLSNEEVTADGRSVIGNFPVFRRNLRQWMMRITAYADRLIDDLDRLDWPESVKAMQRNWIGRSPGASITFGVAVADPAAEMAASIEVFTTRPDTVFGAMYMVLAPEHPLVDEIVAESWPAGTDPRWTAGAATPALAVAEYRLAASRKSDLERQQDTVGRAKTGVFLGAYAENPATGTDLPVFVADYVLMGYGTGAIMGVPGQDTRDWDFAVAFGLPIVRTVQPPAEHPDDEAYSGEGPAINSANDEISLDGLGVADAKAAITDWLAAHGQRCRPHPVQAAGLAVLPAAVLGRAVSDRLRRRGRRDRAAGQRASPAAAGDLGLLARGVRPGRRAVRPRAAAGAGSRVGDRHAGPGRRAATVPPRVERHAAVGRILLVRAALPGSDQREGLLRPGRRALLDGPQKSAQSRRRQRPWRRRPVRRWRGTRGAAPVVFAVLAQGPVRPGARVERGAVPPAVQPGVHPGVRLHRRPRRLRPRRRGRRGHRRAATSSRASPCPGSTGRWASR